MTLPFGLFVTVTLFSTMLALGLSLRPEELQTWMARPALPVRVLIGSCLLVPLAGILLLLGPGSELLSPATRHAIGLMAICPSAPLAMRRVRSVRADHQLAALLQVGAALASILSVPLMVVLIRSHWQLVGWQVYPRDVALQVLRVQLLPLLLGLGLRRTHPGLADRLEQPLSRWANALLLLLLLLLVLVMVGPKLLIYTGANLPAFGLMALLVVLSLLIGRLMAGRSRDQGTTAALVTAMRNPGLAFLLANQHAEGLPNLKLSILGYVLITVLVSIPWLRWARRTS